MIVNGDGGAPPPNPRRKNRRGRERRLALGSLLLTLAIAAAGAGCRRPEPRDSGPSPEPGKAELPSLSGPAPASTAAAAAGADPHGVPSLAAPSAQDDDDDSVAPPSAGRRPSASAGASNRRRRSTGGSGHASEPSGAASSADPYDTELKVTRLVVSKGVSGREPVGAASTFHAADVDKLYAFVELANDARVKDDIYVTFAPVGGGAQHRVKLEVGSEPRWRTWAFTRRPKTPGAWTAVVKTSSGKVLASTSFEVKP